MISAIEKGHFWPFRRKSPQKLGTKINHGHFPPYQSWDDPPAVEIGVGDLGERFDPFERWLDNPGWLDNLGDEILPSISHFNYRVHKGYMGIYGI